jgi:DNA-binding CsgD family transcriptional regulator
MFVREADHVRALRLLETAAATDSRAGLVANVMPALQTLFHADEVSHADVLPRTGQVAASTGYPTPVTALPDAHVALVSRAFEHPWVAHVARRGTTRSVRLSDLCSRAELRRSAFYQDFYRPRGVDYADYQAVSVSGGRAVGFSLGRTDRDFTGDEHDLFEHLRRPLSRVWHLVSRVEALDTAAAVTNLRPAGVTLTPAERRVSDLVLRGWRTAVVAQTLGVSPKAVEQHLTRIYRKAEVGSRAEYIARARASTATN